jgi:hypothetical protein
VADINWAQVAVGFFCVGAFGTVLKIAFDVWSTRVQPVAYDMDVVSQTTPLPSTEVSMVSTKIVYDTAGTSVGYSRITLVFLKVQNAGKADIAAFQLGLDFPFGYEVVGVNCWGPDRHYRISTAPPCNPASRQKPFTSIFKPFNRGVPFSIIRITSQHNRIGGPSRL